MTPFRNGSGKRILDISEDKKVILIEVKGNTTRITVNKDGTLNVENLPQKT